MAATSYEPIVHMMRVMRRSVCGLKDVPLWEQQIIGIKSNCEDCMAMQDNGLDYFTPTDESYPPDRKEVA